MPLSVATLERLAVESPDLAVPWPAAVRDDFVRLLGSGRAGIGVWEDLEAAGMVVRWLPDWERIRHKPQRTPIHRHTVDRHSIEAVAEAAELTREVSRPDLLLVAALLHDVGKGWPGDHSATGSVIAQTLAVRMGFDEDDVTTVAELVRHHLLLPAVATSRDLDDPATTTMVAELVRRWNVWTCLALLTEADARAAGPQAWTPWRASLVRDLVRRVRAHLLGADPDPSTTVSRVEPWVRTLASSGAFDVMVAAPDLDEVCKVTVVAPDRLGLMAAVAGVLTLHRLEVRGASIDTVGGAAVQVWRTVSAFGPPPDDHVLRNDLRRALDGSLDVTAKLASRRRDRAHVDGAQRTPAGAAGAAGVGDGHGSAGARARRARPAAHRGHGRRRGGRLRALGRGRHPRGRCCRRVLPGGRRGRRGVMTTSRLRCATWSARRCAAETEPAGSPANEAADTLGRLIHEYP